MLTRSISTLLLGIPFSLGILLFCLPASGQEADTIVLENIAISSSRINEYTQKGSIQHIDSSLLLHNTEDNLSTLLQRVGYSNIRSYGNTGLATGGLRGSGSNHTQILWNGLNIGSPLNGSADLSLIPSIFIDRLDVQLGASANLIGSGAIGGSILIDNLAPRKEGWALSTHLSINDIGKTYAGIKTTFAAKNYAGSLRLFYNRDENDFKYLNTYQRDPQEAYRNGGEQEQYGVLQENYFDINKHNTANLLIWLQSNELHVAEVVSAASKENATQSDEIIRISGGWEHQSVVSQLKWQSALSYQETGYVNPTISENTISSFLSHSHQLSYTYQGWELLQIEGGAELLNELGKSDSYEKEQSRFRQTLFAAIKYQLDFVRMPMTWSFTAREEWVEGSRTPFIPGISVSFDPARDISIYLKTSRMYRIPTFNDLYWKGADALGNPDLSPEEGWNYESGISVSQSITPILSGTLHASVYSSHVDNWIQWSDAFNNYWEPVNLLNVWARGLNTDIAMSYAFSKKISTSINAGYQYTKSTLEESAAENSNSIGNQLTYTPMHQGNAGITFQYLNISLSYFHRLYSKQYTDMNNSDIYALDAYQVGDVSLNYFPQWNTRWRTNFGISIHNLWNEAYEVRRGYPMPLQNFSFSLKFFVD